MLPKKRIKTAQKENNKIENPLINEIDGVSYHFFFYINTKKCSPRLLDY